MKDQDARDMIAEMEMRVARLESRLETATEVYDYYGLGHLCIRSGMPLREAVSEILDHLGLRVQYNPGGYKLAPNATPKANPSNTSPAGE